MHLSTWVDAAEAMMTRLDGGPTVSGIVPRGFSRYLRIFSPVGFVAGDGPDPLVIRVPWSLICEQLDVPYTPSVLWMRDIASVDPRVAEFVEPGLGRDGTDVFERVNRILHARETEDRSWYFATWPGYGVVANPKLVWFRSHHHDSLEMSAFERWNEAAKPAVLPRVPISAGSASLLTALFGDAGSTPSASPSVSPTEPVGEVPMYWWPDAGDWVLGQPLYGRSFYLACNDVIADEVLATAGIEAVEVSLGDEADFEE